jgi:hypothetical protein
MVSKNPASAFRRGAAAVLFLTITTLGITSSKSSIPNPASQREATAQQFVGKTLRTWQDRLNLNDWSIRVELVRANKLEPKTLGNVHWDLDTKRATIDVLSSYDYTLSTPEMLKDMEFTVVHELVHLDLASLPHTRASVSNEEYAVNQLAHALQDLATK